MNWQFSNDAPIYAQLIGQIRAGIVSGAFSPGERLPSVRYMPSAGLLFGQDSLFDGFGFL